MTSLSVGSLLDDNAWHDVEIRREQRNVTFLVDRVRIDDIILGDFKRLDLNQEVGIAPLQMLSVIVNLYIYIFLVFVLSFLYL